MAGVAGAERVDAAHADTRRRLAGRSRRAGAASWYRIVHDGTSRDWLTLGDVECVLAPAGIDLGDQQEAPFVDE